MLSKDIITKINAFRFIGIIKRKQVAYKEEKTQLASHF